MKNNSLDEIIKCNIEISNPVSNVSTFDTILFVVPPPANAGENSVDKVFSIRSADELLDYGYTQNSVAFIGSQVAFSQSPRPDKLLICARKKTSGEALEDIASTLSRANDESKFYGIHLSVYNSGKDLTDAISWTEANEKILGFEFMGVEENAFPVKNTNYFRTFTIYSGSADGYEPKGDQPVENNYAALAWMAKCFGYDPGSETWHLKELSTIVPSAISSAKKDVLQNLNSASYLRYAGSNVTFGGKTLAGEWIDVIRFRDWLKSEIQTNVFNALKVNRKVPFTDQGIGMIAGQIEATLKKGQTIGGIAPTEYDEDDNVIPGYVVNVPRVSDLTEAERKSRKLTGCSYKARLAGAIHAVEISGYLSF